MNGRAPEGAAAIPPTSREVGLPADIQTVSTYGPGRDSHKAYTRDPSFSAAKGGDGQAAKDLVLRHVTQENLEEARQKFGKNAHYVPVRAENLNGRNKIPTALASRYAHATDGNLENEILQTNRVHHTGKSLIGRMKARAEFGGPVVKGGKYVLVDDVGVLGGTLAELADHIRKNGGEVKGVVTLADTSDRGIMGAPEDRVAAIRKKYGDGTLKEFGIHPEGLTDTEAAALLRHRGALADDRPNAGRAGGSKTGRPDLVKRGSGVLGEDVPGGAWGEAVERSAGRSHEDVRADRAKILKNLADEIRKSGGQAGSGVPANLPEILKHVGALAQNIAEETGLYGKDLHAKVQEWLAPLASFGLSVTDDQIRKAHANCVGKGAAEAKLSNPETVGAYKVATGKMAADPGIPLVNIPNQPTIQSGHDAGKAAVDEGRTDPLTLAQSINSKPRQITPVEIGALNQGHGNVRNSINAIRTEIGGLKSSGQPHELQSALLRQRIEEGSDIVKALRRGGSQNPAALNALRMGSALDDGKYAGAISLAEDIKGAPLTAEERGKIGSLHNVIDRTTAALRQEQEAHADTQSEKSRIADLRAGQVPPGKQGPIGAPNSPRGAALKNDLVWLQAQRRQLINSMAKPTAADIGLKLRRMTALSGRSILGNITGTSASNPILTPIEDLFGSVMRSNPRFRGSAETTFSPTAYVKGTVDFFKSVVDGDAVNTFKAGINQIGAEAHLRGEHDSGSKGETMLGLNETPSAYNLFQRLHAALHTPIQRYAFTAEATKLTKMLAQAGKDVSDPEIVSQIATKAYAKSLEAALLNDNRAASMVNGFFHDVERHFGSAAGNVAKWEIPFAPATTNAAGHRLEYAGADVMREIAGLVVKDLKPAEVDATIRAYKRAGVAAGVVTLAYYLHEHGGISGAGLWDPQNPKAVPAGGDEGGDMEIGGWKVPHGALESPLLGLLNLGVSFSDAYSHTEGTMNPIYREAQDTVEHSPARIVGEMPKIGDGNQLARYLLGQAQGPALMGDIARGTDLKSSGTVNPWLYLAGQRNQQRFEDAKEGPWAPLIANGQLAGISSP